MIHDVIVVGAGVSGLQCARELRRRGAEVVVLDRADKPGGRCATRRFDGAIVDYGPVFFHGDDPGFLRAVRDAEGGPVEGWPRKVEGSGKPCQPQSFSPGETRMGLAEGVNVFARALAVGLDIRLNTQVIRIEAAGNGFSAIDADAQRFQSRDLVLALALEQALPILQQLEPREEVAAARGLLGMFSTVPCLTAIAGYSAEAPRPAWDIHYPEEDQALLLISNESGKREAHALVIQAAPRWSRAHLEEPRDTWAAQLVSRAARLLGPWAATPAWRYAHRWRYARLDRSNELAAPIVLSLGRGRLGLCGELFSAGGGLQAAWKSGAELAGMLRT